MGKRRKIAAALLVLCLLMGCNGEPAVAVVPDVTETDKDTAVTVLTQQGFIPVVKEVADPTAPIGTILRTDPPAGSYVAVGGKVYLFVAADTATTAPFSTTAQPLAPTSIPQASTSATQVSTSLHQTTTTTSPTTTVTHPCAAGHTYAEGICNLCGAADPHFVPTLSLGQTWTVENQWSFTLLSVAAHTLCNPVHNSAENFKNQQVITIRYAYENLGFVSDSEPLSFDATTFIVTAKDGAEAPSYGCLHEEKAIPCAVGASCTAEETYAVDETCRHITLLVTMRTSDGRGIKRIQFDISLP